MANVRSGPRPSYRWIGMGDTWTDEAIPAKFQPASAGNEFAGTQTIRRIRGTWGATLNAGAVQELLIVRAGIRIVSSDAANVGITVIPGPALDRRSDWIWTGQLYLSSGAEAAIIPQQLSSVGVIDSKAMRKVRATDVVLFVVEVVAAEYVDQAGTLDGAVAFDVLTSGAN